MTKYKVSYKHSLNKDIKCPILIPNNNWKVNFAQKALIFLQRRDNLDVDRKIIVYAVKGYFLNYNDESKEISEIKFTERNFLTELTQKEIRKKLKASKHIEQIIELNDQYEIINPKINKNDYIKPKNGILTLEEFLFNSTEVAFCNLRVAHRNVLTEIVKEDIRKYPELFCKALSEINYKQRTY